MFTLHDIYEKTNRQVGQRTIRQIIIAFTVLFVPVVAFSYIAYQVHEGDTLALDSRILLGIYHRSTPVLNEVVLFTTNAGGVLAVIGLGGLTVGIYLWRQKWQACAQIIAGIAGAGLINFFLKLLFARDRPELWHQLINETNYSFPSGHAMLSGALAFSLVVVLWHTKLRWYTFALATVYIIWIGFTRMYLGVHYPTDIIAGWCVSAAWVLTVAFILGSIRWHRSSPRQATSKLK